MDVCPVLPCLVNNVPIKFDPDTGSQLTILGKNHYANLLKKLEHTPKVKDVRIKVKAANDTPMTFLGYFSATLSNKNATHIEKIYILAKDMQDPPLLSKTALLKLGFIKFCTEGSFAVKSVSADLTEDELKQKVDFLHTKYHKVFEGVGLFKDFEVELQIKEDATPFVIRAIPCPVNLRKQAQERLDYFVKVGILRPIGPSEAIQYCSPLLVIEKPNKKEIRLVCHFKELNKRLLRTRQVPAVGLEEFARVCRGFKFWFKLDLRHSYHQLALSKKSQQYCIISTFAGCYAFLRLPMGLCNSQDYFDACVESALANCTQTVCVRDDILGGGFTAFDCLSQYELVLESLVKVGFTCDISKTCVGLTEVTFFGMTFTQAGMKPDCRKVEALRLAPVPRDQKQLDSFVCMVAWNDTFILRFAELVRPLRDLARTKGTYLWLPIHEKAFQTLKTALCEECLNNYFQEDLETFLFTDAGKVAFSDPAPSQGGGFSAVLAQKCPKTGSFLPIHFASRSISKVEASYSQPELEARALRYGVDKFRYYLTGLAHFTVYVDCKSLVPLFEKASHTAPPRIFRQILALQDLTFTVKYRPGRSNPADWCSRTPIPTLEDINDMELSDDLEHFLVRSVLLQGEMDPQAPIAIEEIRRRTLQELSFLTQRIISGDWSKHKKDPRIKPYMGVHSELSVLEDIILRGARTIVLPDSLHSRAAKLVHSIAHSGSSRAEFLLRDHFWFPGYSTLIRTEVELCQTCKHVVPDHRKEPLAISPVPTRPFEQISVDYKGPFHKSPLYALCFLCLYSRWPEIYFVNSTSFEAAKKHFVNFFSHWGFPNSIKTDNGSPFQSGEFKDWLKSLGIKHSPITPEHPQFNEVESHMRLVKKTYEIARLHKVDHEEQLRKMLMVKRATPHPAIQMSPHEAVTGWRMNPGLLQGRFPVDPKIGLTQEQQYNLHRNLIDSKIKTKIQHDSQRNVRSLDLRSGDYVLVRLGLNKRPERDMYQVITVKGKQVTAINTVTGRIIRRTLDRFQKLLKQNLSLPVVPDQTQEVPEDPVPTTALALPTAAPAPMAAGGPAPAPNARPEPALPVPAPVAPVVQPRQEAAPRPARNVHFNPQVEIREVNRFPQNDSRLLRSHGNVPDFPNVMPSNLTTSTQYRADVLRRLNQHAPAEQPPPGPANN